MPYAICVSIGNVSVDECIKIIKTSEMAELRLDLMGFHKSSGDKLVSDIKKIFSSGTNIIATCRTNKELDDDKRFELLSLAVDAGAKYVDLEVDSSDYFKQRIINYIKNKDNKKLIISYHNCEKTPSREELLHTVEWCNSYGPDVIKIACLSHSDQDNARLLALLDSSTPMIVIGMGEKGRPTRFLAPLLGAFCSFASPVGFSSTAPGQVTKQELEAFFKAYKG